MIIINSINFENLVVCLTENYHPTDIPMNTTELTTFADPLYFNGKEVIIITAEDEDMEDLMTMIDKNDPVEETSAASLMHRIAVEMIYAVTQNLISDLIAGDWTSGESLVDFYKTQEPGFAHEVWEHAVHEAKVRVMTMLER